MSHKHDSEFGIQMCLHCEKPRCTNCIAYADFPSDSECIDKPVKMKILELYRSGKTKEEIACEVNRAVGKVYGVLYRAGFTEKRKKKCDT